MNVHIIHPNGKRYTIPAVQVVVENDDGATLAVAYETAGLIVYTDATKDDFRGVVRQLGLATPDVKVLNV